MNASGYGAITLKPGWATSEFWGKIAIQALMLVPIVAQIVPPTSPVGIGLAVVSAALEAYYNKTRADAKKNAAAHTLTLQLAQTAPVAPVPPVPAVSLSHVAAAPETTPITAPAAPTAPVSPSVAVPAGVKVTGRFPCQACGNVVTVTE